MQYIYKDMNKVFKGGPNESNHSFFETVEQTKFILFAKSNNHEIIFEIYFKDDE